MRHEKGEDMTNEEFVEKIQAGEDVIQNMEQLWIQNKGMVAHIAWRYRERAELDDLMQEGFLGIREAVGRYNQTKGVPFINYAAYWIRQKMIRYIKGNDVIKVPEHMRSHIETYNRAFWKFMQEYARNPTKAEISHITGLCEKEIDVVRKAIETLKTGSMDAPIGEDESNTLNDILPSSEPGIDEKDAVLDKIENEQLAEILWEMVDELPGQQSRVLRGYYQEGKTYKQIGEAVGYTVEQVRQLQQKGLRELRKPKHSDILREFLYDSWIYSRGLSGNGVGAFNISWTSSTERTAMRMIEKEEEIEAVMHEPRTKQEGI